MLDYDLLSQTGSLPAKNILLVFHGLGADKHNLKFLYSLWPPCGLQAYFFQAPTRQESFFGSSMRLPSWFNIKNLESEHPQAADQRASFFQSCEHIIKPHLLQGARLHVVGFSQGGVMALEAAQYFDCQTIGLLSTFWPQDVLPNIIETPFIFQSHGLADDVVPYEQAAKLMRLLKNKGYELTTVLEDHLTHGISLRIEKEYSAFIRHHIATSIS